MTVFKLGKMTFGSLFKKPSTVQYPFEKKPQPEGLKGQIAIDTDACILCGVCEKNCTTSCISVSKADRFWQIDRYGCIQCGYCVTVCPKKCLVMLPDYAPSVPEMTTSRYEVPEAAQTEKKAPTAAQVEAKESKPPTEGQLHNEILSKEMPSRETIDAVEAADGIHNQTDYQVDDLLRLMDEDKARKVRDALHNIS